MRSTLLLASMLALASCDQGGVQQVPGVGKFSGSGVVPAGERFDCLPIMLWDGDGPFTCAEGPKVRLSGVAAREMDGTCRNNQPCPDASAESARDYLARLLGTPAGFTDDGHVLLNNPAKLSCRSLGNGVGSRTAAWCVSPRVGDLSCAMVKSGLALRWDKFWRGHRC
jgi:endonuclease YncB( thermonuclease family)